MILKQLVAVIDRRTTVVCLHAAGQIQPVDEPFETLAGDYDAPPFHMHCRSIVVPWMAGMVSGIRKEANDELLRRPLKQRRIGPGGQIGGYIPPPPTPPTPMPSLPPKATFRVLGTPAQQDMSYGLAESDFRYIADPQMRSTALWQHEYEGQRAIKQIMRNLEAGRDPYASLDLDPKFVRRFTRMVDADMLEIASDYTVDELKAELLNAALDMKIRIASATVPDSLLYRGMTFDGDIRTVLKVGDRIDLQAVSATTDAAEARLYTRKPGQKVVMEIRSVPATDLSSTASGKMRASHEHVLAGDGRVVSITEDGQRIVIVIEG
jgi:hypothetical protein